jgi:hypothetical protein
MMHGDTHAYIDAMPPAPQCLTNIIGRGRPTNNADCSKSMPSFAVPSTLRNGQVIYVCVCPTNTRTCVPQRPVISVVCMSPTPHVAIKMNGFDIGVTRLQAHHGREHSD